MDVVHEECADEYNNLVESLEPLKKKRYLRSTDVAGVESDMFIQPRYWLRDIIWLVQNLLLYEHLQTLCDTGDSALIFKLRNHVTELQTCSCNIISMRMLRRGPTYACRCSKYYKRFKSPINPQRFPKIKILDIRRSAKNHPLLKDGDISPLSQFKYLTHLHLPVASVRNVTKSLPLSLIHLTIVCANAPKKLNFKHLVNLRNLFINSKYGAGGFEIFSNLPSNLSHLKISAAFGPAALAKLPAEISHLDVSEVLCKMSDLPRKLVFLRCHRDGAIFTCNENPPPHWEAFSSSTEYHPLTFALPPTVTDVDFSGRVGRCMIYDQHDVNGNNHYLNLRLSSETGTSSFKIIRNVLRHDRMETLGPSLNFIQYLRIGICYPQSKSNAVHFRALKKLSSLETLRIELDASCTSTFFVSELSEPVEEPLDILPSCLKRLEMSLNLVDDWSNFCLSNLILPNSLERINILRFCHLIPLTITTSYPEFQLPTNLKSIDAVIISPHSTISNILNTSCLIKFSETLTENRRDVRFSSTAKFIPRCHYFSYSYPSCNFENFSLHTYEPWGWEIHDRGNSREI